MSYDVVTRFAKPVAANALEKTLLDLIGFRAVRGGGSWTCERRDEGCHFTVEVEGGARAASKVSELKWRIAWGGSREAIFTFANAIAEVVEKHAGMVVLGGAITPAGEEFQRIVETWTNAGAPLDSLVEPVVALEGLVWLEGRKVTRVRVGQLLTQLSVEAEHESAREALEALGPDAIFDACWHEADRDRAHALEEILDEMGASLPDLMARHVPLPELIALVTKKPDEPWNLEEALEKLGAPAVDALWKACEREKDPDRRFALRMTLETVSGKDVAVLAAERVPVRELLDQLDEPGDVGVTAQEAVERLGEAAVGPIFEAYERARNEDRRTSLRATLENLGEAARVPVLELLRVGGPRARVELALQQASELAPGLDLLGAVVARLLADPTLVDDGLDFTLGRFAKSLGAAAVPELLRLALGSSAETRATTSEVLTELATSFPEARAALERLRATP